MKILTTIFVTLMLFSSCTKQELDKETNCDCGRIWDKYEIGLPYGNIPGQPYSQRLTIKNNCDGRSTNVVDHPEWSDLMVGDYVCNY
jgi:hypothetical protein